MLRMVRVRMPKQGKTEARLREDLSAVDDRLCTSCARNGGGEP